jgi:hypothetical protein
VLSSTVVVSEVADPSTTRSVVAVTWAVGTLRGEVGRLELQTMRADMVALVWFGLVGLSRWLWCLVDRLIRSDGLGLDLWKCFDRCVWLRLRWLDMCWVVLDEKMREKGRRMEILNEL